MTAAEAISIMTPAVAIGNAISIVLGGILVKVIHSKELNGQGKLMRSVDAADELGVSEEMQAKRNHIDVRNMGIGMFISCSFFAWGYIVAKIWNTLVPSISIHAYAWMIISVAVCKIFNIIPEDIEVDCYQWFQFIMKNLTPALLVGIGLCYLELGTVISSFSLTYLVLCFLSCIGCLLYTSTEEVKSIFTPSVPGCIVIIMSLDSSVPATAPCLSSIRTVSSFCMICVHLLRYAI